MLLGLIAAAEAAERSFERGEFLVERSAVTVEVRRAVVPDAPAVPVPTEQDRICRVSLSWDGKVAAQALGCHPSVAASAEQAVAQWSLSLAPAPVGQLDLLVVWLRFPGPVTEDGVRDSMQMVDIGVSAVPGAEIVAIPNDVRRATPARATLRVPIKVPPELAKSDVTCDIRLAVGEDGVPFNLAAPGCADPHLTHIRNAVLDWRFAPATFGIEPARVNIPLRVRWANGVAAFEQANAADSEARYIAVAPKGEEPTAEAAAVERYVPPPLPDHPPILVLHRANYAPVDIYEMPLPPPAAGPGRCVVNVQVRKDRRTSAWPGEPCDAAVRDASIAAISGWDVNPGADRENNEIYARFVLTFIYGDDGAPRMVVDARDVVGADERPLPPGVGTYLAPEPM